jgi:hypothetical protein
MGPLLPHLGVNSPRELWPKALNRNLSLPAFAVCRHRSGQPFCGPMLTFVQRHPSDTLAKSKDSIFGGDVSPYGAVFDADDKDGLASISVNEVAAKVADPQAWIEESAELAKQYAYAPPISLSRNAVLLTRDYETNARNIARSQAALAAARLANLLNNALK